MQCYSIGVFGDAVSSRFVLESKWTAWLKVVMQRHHNFGKALRNVIHAASSRLHRPNNPILASCASQLTTNAVYELRTNNQCEADTHIENVIHFIPVDTAKSLKPGKQRRNRNRFPVELQSTTFGQESFDVVL